MISILTLPLVPERAGLEAGEGSVSRRGILKVLTGIAVGGCQFCNIPPIPQTQAHFWWPVHPSDVLSRMHLLEPPFRDVQPPPLATFSGLHHRAASCCTYMYYARTSVQSACSVRGSHFPMNFKSDPYLCRYPDGCFRSGDCCCSQDWRTSQEEEDW